MRYVNILDNDKYTEYIENNKHYTWEDSLTNTHYYIEKSEYNSIINDLEKEFKDIGSITKIKESKNYKKIPFIIGDKILNSLYEYSKLFVLFSYIIYREEFTNKEELRLKAYKAFISGDNKKFKKAWDAIFELSDNKNSSKEKYNQEIYLLKGGPYKIKKYYLENNDLKSIRGASTLMNYVSETIIFDFIKEKYIEECIVYIGGSKIFAILPTDVEKKIYLELEDKFNEYTISLQTAFCLSEKTTLSNILSKETYKNEIDTLDMKLDERKKLKIYNEINIRSKYENDKFELWENSILSSGFKVVDNEKEICDLCKAKYSIYKLYEKEDNKLICASCAHKSLSGREAKKSFIEECFNVDKNKKEYNKKNMAESLDDIAKCSNNDIAILYADGNNIGGLLNEMDTLYKHMYFSRKFNSVTKNLVFKTIRKFYSEYKLEIVAIGGDDIFLILPAKKIIEFSKELMNSFEKEFKNLSNDTKRVSLSVGISIAKYKTQIKEMLENAEDALKSAKQKSRNSKESTIDIVFMDKKSNNQSCNCENINSTLMPYNLSDLENIYKMMDNFKSKRNIKTFLNNLLYGFINAQSIIEAKLFYLYNLSRRDNNSVDVGFINKNISEIDKLYYDCGFYSDNDKEMVTEKKYYFIWKDILNLWDYAGGDK